MTQPNRPLIRSLNSAVPAFAGALVACAYLFGAVVFSVASQAESAAEPALVASEPVVTVAASPATRRPSW